MTLLEGPIDACSSPKDIRRFLKDVTRHTDIVEIKFRRCGYLAEVEARGGKYVAQWSNLRHAGHVVAQQFRSKLYDDIRHKLLPATSKAALGTRPLAVIIIGPPGAGKTSLAVPWATKKFGVTFSSINPDDVKELLPEYEGWNAEALHEESADLAEADLERHACNRRLNFIYDVVGKDSNKVARAISDFDTLGYRTYLMFTDLPSWKAANRVWERFQANPFHRDQTLRPGRFVPPEYAHTIVGNLPSKTFKQLKKHPLIGGYCWMNADVPKNCDAEILEKKGM